MHSRSCWWSASESHRSGYLLARQIRVPSPHPRNQKLLTATTRSIRIHWPRLATTSRFGTAGWTRTTVSPLKRRDSRPLSYDGTGWCSVLESNQAGPQGTPGLQPGRGPSPSNATFGAQCRLSACDIRFVGPTLFTSELTGHELATTSGNDPLSPSRQLGCDTCRISGQNWLPTCGSNAARPD